VSFARGLSSERNGRASYEAVSLFIAGESLAALVPERWRKFPIAVRTAAGASPAWRRRVSYATYKRWRVSTALCLALVAIVGWFLVCGWLVGALRLRERLALWRGRWPNSWPGRP
jgi:hypothetical protein